MKDEKMMILKMLEEGKITSEEAIELIDAIDTKSSGSKNKEDSDKNITNQIFNALGELGNDMGNLLSRSIDEIKEFGSNLNIGNNYETINNNADIDISHIENVKLDFKSVNGKIRIHKTEGDKVLIHSKCDYKKGVLDDGEIYFDFFEENGKVTFLPKYKNNISIDLDILVPNREYDHISLETSNGQVLVENIKSNTINISTSNGSIDTYNSKFKNLTALTKNGRIEVRDVISDEIDLNTSNSSILLMMIKTNNISAKTSNSKIIVNDLDANQSRLKTTNSSISLDGSMVEEVYLNTSNGRINVRDLDIDKLKLVDISTNNGDIDCKVYNNDYNYIFDLETSSGNLDLDIPSLVYEINKQPSSGSKKVLATTPNFTDGIKIKATTSNGFIKIY